ncbi:hypothetical protein ACJIZ3_019876 [Penstemon smallii]|uniref:Uncharacterized protein n=1 Tax=Penstemon smallii TaxID=265156 RepID=A0ABD3T2F0_9LAMI
MAHLTHETKNENLNDLDVLNESCKKIAAKMQTHFGRRYTKQTIKKKLKQMRARHNSFKRFIFTPGVTELELFKQFRRNGNPLHYMLMETFDRAGVATFPKDLSGSPGWPIHMMNSKDVLVLWGPVIWQMWVTMVTLLVEVIGWIWIS